MQRVGLAGAGVGAVAFALLVASCSSSSSGSDGPPIGPGGAYDVYMRCAPYYGDKCKGQRYSNFMQCDERPEVDCEPAPEPSPDRNQTVWCCKSPCVRGDPDRDFRCIDGGRMYVCNSDAKIDPATIGCTKGPDYPVEICC